MGLWVTGERSVYTWNIFTVKCPRSIRGQSRHKDRGKWAFHTKRVVKTLQLRTIWQLSKQGFTTNINSATRYTQVTEGLDGTP